MPVLGMIASGVVFELGLLAPSAQGTLVAFVGRGGAAWTVRSRILDDGRRARASVRRHGRGA